MIKTLYWASTLITTFFLLLSAYSYFFSKNTIEGLRDLGFPDFFRVQLGVLKLLAVAVLLLPGTPTFIKDWGYVGVGLFLLTAMVAHIAHRDSVLVLGLLVLLFGALVASRYTFGLVMT